MEESEVEISKSSILYELLVLSEWIEDYDSLISKKALNNSIQESSSYFNPWKYLKKSKLENLRFLQTEYPWHLAVSNDGKVVAVLQETLLEIKTAKDEYSSIVGKACIPNDQCPKLRKMAWSSDNSFLALARDNGTVHVFNLFGCNVATVEPMKSNNDALKPVVALFFLSSKFDSAKWSNELLIVYHNGEVKSILLSHIEGFEYVENIKYSLEFDYPQGISSVAYGHHHLLFVAGPPTGKEQHGITVWRILNDYPYLKTVFDSEKSTGSSKSFLRYFTSFSNQSNPRTIYKMQVSPGGNLLACLHFSGEISLWKLPGILLYRKWSLHEQPEYNKCRSENQDISKNLFSFHPVDIRWWSDEALVIARRNGALSVCSIKNLHNLLGDSPEFLAESPQISSIVGERSGVIALECETACHNKSNLEAEGNASPTGETSAIQESIQAALYSVTDIEMFEPKRKAPKVIQRTYRLLALKRTTPEELYTRKIDHEEYDEALLLANKYNLDCDLVYQKRWRNSQVSKDSIYNFLNKVKKNVWVVKECVERVPEDIEDAKELLKFGLEKTELDNPKFNRLNSEEKQLIIYRNQLLRFSDSLTIYEKIIGSPEKYNSIDYDEFRKKSSLVATVNFARQEHWQAVSIMFTYVGHKILSHWLPLLSNFPETLRPLCYRSLLPEVVQGEVIPWEVQHLRDPDWSELPPFKSLNMVVSDEQEDILYKHDSFLREFMGKNVTVEMVEKWYKTRTYEIEMKTGLVDNALAFVVLAKERGIQGLDQLHNDLLTLESLVYIVGDDSITLSKLEGLSQLDQCKLLLSKTGKNSFIDDLKNLIVPYAKRCKDESRDSSYSLLRNILLYFSESSLELPLELLNYLKGGFLNPFTLSLNETVNIVLDCIYSCPKDDQLETCFLILECLPQRENSLSKDDAELHDRIDKLEIHLEACEILNRYKTPKSVNFVSKNEHNADIGKELMQSIADYTKRESLDFEELLSDLQFLQSNIFTSVPPNYCYELCALSQMTCECEEIIQSAEHFLECRKGEKNKQIPFEKSIELVLLAARSHFEKATNFDDYCIQLAQTCLRLIEEPHPHICEELDLIEAVQLLGDFHVNMLPIQVRKHDNRIVLIESCLKAKPKNYKACQRLLQLAQTLRIYGDDRTKREGEVLILIAEHALNSEDFQYCSEICNRLVSRNFSPAWTIVRLLAQNEAFDNNLSKKLFFAFAILHCPSDSLEELIEWRITLHTKYFE